MILKIQNKRRQHPSTRAVRIVHFIPALVGWALLSGCFAPIYYAPDTHNVPLLQQKGEGMLSFAGGGGDTLSSVTPGTLRVDLAALQGAYAITNQFALMLNMASFKLKEDLAGDGGTSRLLEFGLGYYLPLSQKTVFETYGLVGGGDIENHFPSTLSDYPMTTGTIESKLFRYGIQSAIGFKTKYMDVAISARIVQLNYSDISGSLIFLGEDQVQYLNREDSHLLVERAFTLRFGYDFLKLQVQVGDSENLSSPNFRQEDGYATVGIGYYLDK